MFSKKAHFHSMFSSKRDFAPAKVVMEDEQEVVVPIEKKKKKEVRWLPGERLLIKLSKDKKKKIERQVDMQQIENSMQNILRLF